EMSSKEKKVRVLFACGSRSMRRVRLFLRANAAARLTAVVVLPTPPFWFAIAMTVPMFGCQLASLASRLSIHGLSTLSARASVHDKRREPFRVEGKGLAVRRPLTGGQRA